MKIISYNVNGLRANFKKTDGIKKIIEDKEPDIICLQEIKCSNTQCNDFIEYMKTKGYLFQSLNSAKRPGYSGVATFSKIQPVEEYKEDFTDEGRIQVIEYSKIILMNLYVPNAKPDLSRLKERIDMWESNIKEIIKKLQHKGKQVIITGDFNVAPEEIDLKNYAANRGKHGFTDEERQAFRNLLKECNLVDTFRELYSKKVKYSWFSARQKTARENNSGWRIDMFLTDIKSFKKIKETDILCEYKGSDHCPIILEL
jgi:exodeoxyribonuclease-3